ncbi:hypothetical protein BUALT_Bualt17G0044900 [Buddleja alternifolia]|uniref:Uncharacterized protein n=1 Tax=Buddleja alternifolia TaxID=168488 RepID=A0AAV6WEJ6_9LAMI|nr:hypothetical protein BUALT_Bualt17G0044900 [Buddleja alternifolia]
MACALLHNFIRVEMQVNLLEADLEDLETDNEEDNENDNNARLMRYKCWPLYIDWIESFEDLETLNEHNEGEAKNIKVSQAQSSASVKKVGQKKRKLDGNQEQMYQFHGNYCKNTDSRLGEIAIRIGVEYDVATAKNVVYDTVNKVEGLTLHHKLFVTDKLVQKIEDVYMLFSLPEIEQAEYIRMKLVGTM